MKHPFIPVTTKKPLKMGTYNEILKMTEGFPGVRENCIYMFFRGIRAVTGFSLMDIKNYVENHPDSANYNVEDMAETFKRGKI